MTTVVKTKTDFFIQLFSSSVVDFPEFTQGAFDILKGIQRLKLGLSTAFSPFDLCPVCRLADGREALTHVTYIHGDQLGHLSGSAIDPGRLSSLAPEYGEFRVHVVEVCQTCHWNHLVTSYVLGDGVPRKAPSRPRDLLD